MDDARVVDGGQALGDLAADVAAELLGDPLELLQEVAERLALDVLHDEEVLLDAVDAERGVAVVGPDDVLVLDRLADLGLAQEALEEARRLEEVGVDDLEGDGVPGVEAGRRPGRPRPGRPSPCRPSRARRRSCVGGPSPRLADHSPSSLSTASRPVLRPRLHDLAVQPHVLQHRLAVLLGGVLDAVVEEALGFGEVLGLAGGLPEVVAGPEACCLLSPASCRAASAASTSPPGRQASRARRHVTLVVPLLLTGEGDGLVESVLASARHVPGPHGRSAELDQGLSNRLFDARSPGAAPGPGSRGRAPGIPRPPRGERQRGSECA